MKKYMIRLACLSFSLLCVQGHATLLQRMPSKALPKPSIGKVAPQTRPYLNSLRSHRSEDETFISAVANGDGSSNQTVQPGNAILFNVVVDKDGAVTYDPTSGIFTVGCAGSYEITYGGRWTSASSDPVVSLRSNGTVLFASRVDNPNNGGDWVSMSLIVNLRRNARIEIINDSITANPITLLDLAGDTTSAFVTIEKVESED